MRKPVFLFLVLLCSAVPSFAQTEQILPWVGSFVEGDYLWVYNYSSEPNTFIVRWGYSVSEPITLPAHTYQNYIPPTTGWVTITADDVATWAVTGATTFYPVGWSYNMSFAGEGDDNGIAIDNLHYYSVNFTIDIYRDDWTYWGSTSGSISSRDIFVKMLWEEFGLGNLPANFHAVVDADDWINGVVTDCGTGLPCTVVTGT